MKKVSRNRRYIPPPTTQEIEDGLQRVANCFAKEFREDVYKFLNAKYQISAFTGFYISLKIEGQEYLYGDNNKYILEADTVNKLVEYFEEIYIRCFSSQKDPDIGIGAGFIKFKSENPIAEIRLPNHSQAFISNINPQVLESTLGKLNINIETYPSQEAIEALCPEHSSVLSNIKNQITTIENDIAKLEKKISKLGSEKADSNEDDEAEFDQKIDEAHNQIGIKQEQINGYVKKIEKVEADARYCQMCYRSIRLEE